MLNHANSHPSEIVFVLIALAGLIVNLIGLIDTRRKHRVFARLKENGLRGYVAYMNLVDEWFRVVSQGLLLAGGLLMLWSIPPPPQLSPENVTARIMLILVAVVLLAKSVTSMRMRRRVLHMDRARYGRRKHD